MTKVTDEELVIAGVREWERCKGRSLAESLLRCHSAMRALEPKEIIPEAAEVLENSGQIAAKEITHKVGQFGLASALYQPPEILTKKIGTPQESVCRPYNVQEEIAGLTRRIAALERAIART